LTPRWLLLDDARRLEDLALLLLRLGTGSFLVFGVWDNVTDPAKMAEFAVFLERFRFPWPEYMARVSVYAQLICGLMLMFGLLSRWAGLVIVFNFVVAIVMVDRLGGIRASWPAAALVLIGFYIAARGAGALSADALLAGAPPERAGGSTTGLTHFCASPGEGARWGSADAHPRLPTAPSEAPRASADRLHPSTSAAAFCRLTIRRGRGSPVEG
jgi:putative oxidoreductase